MNAARNYVWTLNLREEIRSVEDAHSWITGTLIPSLNNAEKHKFSIFQLERAPSTGQLHLQGYSELSSTARFNWIQGNWNGFRTAHFEKRRGSQQQAIDYCKKEESRVAGPWEIGERAIQGQRSDLAEVAEKIKEGKDMASIANDHPSSFIRYSRGFEKLAALIGPKRKVDWEMEVIVYWGTSGSGKTTKAKLDYPDAYLWMPQRGQTIWWDGYNNEDTIIIDEFASNFQYHYALRILSEPGVRVETKGGTICLYAKKIVITSMEPPTKWWPSVTENRYALYRRIQQCYKFSGNAIRGTNETTIDEFPLEFESDPCNEYAPRKWIPYPRKVPSIEEMTRPRESVNSINTDSNLWEWDQGSTQSLEPTRFIDMNNGEPIFFDFNSTPVDWDHLFQ